jgi:hypothetical protein
MRHQRTDASRCFGVDSSPLPRPVREGVSTDSLMFHPSPPCPQGGRSAAVFFPLGYPFPYGPACIPPLFPLPSLSPVPTQLWACIGVWQGVAIDPLKYNFCSPSPTLLCPAGVLPATVFYPLGHPKPYASAPLPFNCRRALHRSRGPLRRWSTSRDPRASLTPLDAPQLTPFKIPVRNLSCQSHH